MKKTKKKVVKKKPKGRTEKDFVAFLEKRISHWKKLLFLERYTFSIQRKTRQSDSYMEIHVNYPYLNSALYYSKESLNDFIQNKDKEQLENAIVHEMIHTITEPLFDKSIRRFVSKDEMNDEREILTDLITSIAIKAYAH